MTCRWKSTSGPMSLASAVRIAESSLRSSAGRRGQPCGAARKSATASVAERLRAQVGHLARLHQHRAADVLDDGLEVMLLRFQEGIEEARRAGAGIRRRHVVEEDVDEL